MILVDIFRIMTAALASMVSATLRRLVGRSVHRAWPARLEAMAGFYRGTWSVMLDIGAVRWREASERMSPELDGGVPTRPLDIAGLEGKWFEPANADDRVLVYYHGGGYVFGSLRTHGKLIGTLAQTAAARTVGLLYRRAPEHPFPAAYEDALTAYRSVLESGVAPERVVLAGDSAGGGIVVETLLALRDAGDPLPAAAVLISPWVDLTCTQDSFDRNAELDYVGRAHCLQCAAHFLGDHDARSPDVSPLFADLHGLPPLLVQVGDVETLYDQIREFSDRAQAAGVDVTLRTYPGMLHVWHLMDGIIPEARAAIDEISAFVQEHTSA